MYTPLTFNPQVLTAQLAQANERSRIYAQRLWQIPFAYLAIAGLALTVASNGPSQLVRLGLVALCLIGVLVVWIMAGTAQAIGRSVDVIQGVEKKLDLTSDGNYSVKKHRILIDIPTFCLVVVGIAGCAIAACSGWGCQD